MSASHSHTVNILKLKDDASNWNDYKSKALIAMGAKGLTGHITGVTRQPKPYLQLNG